MTNKQKETIIKALKFQIYEMVSCRDVRYSEKNYESCDMFNEVIYELEDALRAFETDV